jgi:GDSL-like lipase/acylhydrolase family protein
MGRGRAAGVLLVVLGCLAGVVLGETGYRSYLYFAYPPMFRPPDPGPPVGPYHLYNVSHWEFDERFGYVYPAGRIIDQTKIENGLVSRCGRQDVINQYGNIGPIVGDYHRAALKILVFGDSWSAFHHKGRTWPLVLQETLESRLGLTVHVVNFGRDGYGVLQMFDLAAVKIAEWKPDLVVMAFISDDLDRARFWRTVVGQGDDMRVLTTVEPVRHPDLRRAADTFMLMPSATYEWCRRMAQTGERDAVLERIIRKRRVLMEHNKPSASRVADVLSVRDSFLYNRLVRGDAFAFLRGRIPSGINQSANPRVPYRSYAGDPGFVRSLEQVKATGVPWVLFHLAFYPEIKAQTEYILEPQAQALLESLQTISGKTVLRTTDYVPMPVPQPERMNAGPDNLHPSLWAMEFYANAVAEGLVQNGLVRDRRKP